MGRCDEHRVVNGTALAVKRSALVDCGGRAVSQAVFAAMCGHSQQYQAELERPGPHKVTAEKAGQIEAALNYFSNHGFTRKSTDV